MKKALFSLALLFTGCQAMIYGTASDFNDLSLGMTKQEVIHAIGKPTETLADGDKGEEYMVYKRMRHTISDWPRLYAVTLRGGKVVAWHEVPPDWTPRTVINMQNTVNVPQPASTPSEPPRAPTNK